MKPYPAYKDSGVEWLGEVPEGWEAVPLKYISEIVLGKMLTSNDKGGFFLKPYLRAKNLNWLTVDVTDIKDMWFSERELSLYRLEKDDLLVSEGGEVGRTCIWDSELDECYIQNSVNRVRLNGENNPRYFLFQFFVAGHKGHFDAVVNRVSIAHLTKEKLAEVVFVVPPLPEQTAIAAYLDRKTAQIDSLIEQKRRLISLLQEERTALISQAVTKGLNPAAPMQDSGIEWIGAVPAGWEVKKLKYVFHFLDHRRIPLSADERGKMVNKIYDYYGASGIIDKVDDYIFDEKTILIGEDGANLLARSSRLAFIAQGKYWVNNHAHIVKPKNGNINYLVELLEIVDYTNYVTGSAQPKLSQENLGKVLLPIPPLPEQTAITAYLDKKTTQIDQTIARTEQQIELLHEYRTALISAVVTGKVDVREEVAGITKLAL